MATGGVKTGHDDFLFHYITREKRSEINLKTQPGIASIIRIYRKDKESDD